MLWHWACCEHFSESGRKVCLYVPNSVPALPPLHRSTLLGRVWTPLRGRRRTTSLSKPAVPCGRRRRPGKVTISTSAGVGSFVLLPPAFGVFWSSARSSYPRALCAVWFTTAFFSSSLYDFIVFYKNNTANPQSESSASFFSASERRVFGVPSRFQQVDVLFLYQHCFKVSRWLANAKETLLPLVP